MAAQKKIIHLFIVISFVLTLFPIVNSSGKPEVFCPNDMDKQISSTILSNDPTLEVLDQKQEEMCGISYGAYPPWEFAQSFKPTLTKLTRVSLCLGKGEGTPDNLEITVSIKDDLTGDDLTSTTKHSGMLTNNKPCWIDFDFPDVNVTSEDTYYIVIKTNAGSDRYTVCWYYQYGNPYPRGSAWGSNDNGFEWFILEKYFWDFVDFTFRIYGLNYPPYIPAIKGTLEGKPRTAYQYTFTTIDPEGYNVSYFIDWGDGTTREWIGQYPSGEEITVDHTWNKKETYTLMAKARDMYGYESDWAILEVSMPKNKNIPAYTVLLRFTAIMQARFPRVILLF